MPLEAINADDWLHTDVGCDNNFRLVKDATDLRHNTFMVSASSNKTAFAFHLFESLNTLESSYGA